MNKVIVTGGTGMIGLTLIKKMLNEGITVTAVIRPDSKRRSVMPDNDLLNIVYCDINNILSLKDKLDSDYDTFFHFAWSNTYGSGRDNVDEQEKNIRATIDAVSLASSCGCKTFVGAGSQAEFGHISGEISDSVPKNPITGYGIAKYAAGKLSKMKCEQLGIRHCWGRILSAYGPYDNNYTMVMSSVINMLNNERTKFTKGEQIWDYIFSEDCANAFYLIALKGIHGKAYTIGTGQQRLLKDYIKDIRDAINSELEIGLGEIDYFPNQVMKLVADISELNKDTGFTPEFSFEEGIKKTVEWYKNKKEQENK